MINSNRSHISFSRVIGALYRRIEDTPHYLLWKLPFGFSNRNNQKLEKYRNIHKGKRCFVVANGPSLKKTDLSLLKNEITFGMNRIHLLKEVNGFSPTYLATVDIPTQLQQFTEEYNSLDLIRFFNWNFRSYFEEKENLMFVRNSFNSDFSTDLVKQGAGNSKSVAYTCLQLAYFMGCTEVILIGKDHSYNTEGVGNARFANSTGNESNHFIEGYYKKGMKWGVPDYKMEEYTYQLAKKAFENNGRKILDATIDGKLQVFEKIDYYSLFASKIPQ